MTNRSASPTIEVPSTPYTLVRLQTTGRCAFSVWRDGKRIACGVRDTEDEARREARRWAGLT